MAEPIYAYIHIPKTGGSTLRDVHIRKNYDESAIIDASSMPMASIVDNINSMTKFIIGHHRYGLHLFYAKRPVRYITILRDPVQRFISNYYYLKQTKSHYLYDKVKDMGMTEYLDTMRRVRTCMGNLQSIYLGIPEDTPPRYYSDAVDMVMDNFAGRFAAVGVVEDYNNFIQGLQDKGILPEPGDMGDKRNVAKRKDETFTDEEIHRIKEINMLDSMIYDKITELGGI